MINASSAVVGFLAWLLCLGGSDTSPANMRGRNVVLLGVDQVQTIAWVADGRIMHHIGAKPSARALSSKAGLQIQVESAVFNSTQALAETYYRDKRDVHRVAVQVADFLGVADVLSSPRRGPLTLTAQPARDQPRRLVTAIASASPAPFDTEGLSLAAQLLCQQAERNRQLAAEQSRRRELANREDAVLAQQRKIEFARRLERGEDLQRQDRDRLMAIAAHEQESLTASLHNGVEQMRRIEAQSAQEWHERLKQPLLHESLMAVAQQQQARRAAASVPKGAKSSASGRASTATRPTAANAAVPAFQHVNAVVNPAPKATALDCSPKRSGARLLQRVDDHIVAPVGSCCGKTRDCSLLPLSCGEGMTPQNRACLQHDIDLRQCGLGFKRLDSPCVTAAHRALYEHSTAYRIRVPIGAAALLGSVIQEWKKRKWPIPWNPLVP